MINTQDFIKRLEKIIDYYGLNASSFAEKVGVQRSSISHVLSGRNKPSLEFVMKILSSFEEVDLYWLLNGKGTFPKSEVPKPTLPKIETTNKQMSISNPETIISDITPSSEIERIVIFYKDGRFKNYNN